MLKLTILNIEFHQISQQHHYMQDVNRKIILYVTDQYKKAKKELSTSKKV